MSAEPAAAAEIETTDAAPAADIAIDTTGAVGTDVAAANDPSSEASRAETAANEPSFEEEPKPLADDNVSVDPFNQSAGDRSTADKINKGIAADRMAGDMTLGEPGGGPLKQTGQADKQEKKDEEFWDRIHSLMEESEELKRQEEHARKWDNESHDIAGTRMSGRDFMDMREFQKSEQGRKKISEALQQKGLSEEQAKTAEKKANEYYTILEKRRLGVDLTPEEMAREKDLAHDKDVTLYTKTSNDVIQKNRSLNITTDVERSASLNKPEAVTKPAEPTEDSRYFKNAPLLVGEFDKAKAAIQPLDQAPQADVKKYASTVANSKDLNALGLAV